MYEEILAIKRLLSQISSVNKDLEQNLKGRNILRQILVFSLTNDTYKAYANDPWPVTSTAHRSAPLMYQVGDR